VVNIPDSVDPERIFEPVLVGDSDILRHPDGRCLFEAEKTDHRTVLLGDVFLLMRSRIPGDLLVMNLRTGCIGCWKIGLVKNEDRSRLERFLCT